MTYRTLRSGHTGSGGNGDTGAFGIQHNYCEPEVKQVEISSVYDDSSAADY